MEEQEKDGLVRTDTSGLRWSRDEIDAVGKEGSTLAMHQDTALLEEQHKASQKSLCYRVCGTSAWF